MKFTLLFLFFFSIFLHANATKVDVYTYHDMPPYVINFADKQGLYFDFIAELNSNQPDYNFNLIYMPRKRLDYRLEQNKLNGIVLGVNPKWFKDRNQTRYFWSPAIMEDKDVFVSLNKHPVFVSQLNDLKDKRVGGIRGFRYIGVDKLVAEKQITRVDTQTESQLFDMLKKNRVDTAILSIYTFYFLSENTRSEYYIAKQHHDAFTRHILIPKQDNKLLFETLDNTLINEAFIKNWHRKLDNYTMPVR